jgi:hypothetical protein
MIFVLAFAAVLAPHLAAGQTLTDVSAATGIAATTNGMTTGTATTIGHVRDKVNADVAMGRSWEKSANWAKGANWKNNEGSPGHVQVTGTGAGWKKGSTWKTTSAQSGLH